MAAHPVNMMEVDELAFRIVDDETKIRIIDIRSAESFAQLALPGSMNVPIEDFFRKEWVNSFSQRHLKKVLVGENESQELTACLLLHELGFENLAMLQGGFDAFNKTILTPAPFAPTGTRWDTDTRQFREQAHRDILKMIESNKKKGAKEPKKEKTIQGGC
jgi:rhodanese-related sulfurtransferase